MSPLEEFQTRHGAEWGQIVGTPAFSAALALAHRERLDKVSILTDDEIAARGQIILADLRGHLQYEAVLLGLHEKKEFVFQQLGDPDYPDPIDEANEEARIENGQRVGSEMRESVSASTVASSLHEELFPQPKPQKRRGRPPGKGKKKK